MVNYAARVQDKIEKQASSEKETALKKTDIHRGAQQGLEWREETTGNGKTEPQKQRTVMST